MAELVKRELPLHRMGWSHALRSLPLAQSVQPYDCFCWPFNSKTSSFWRCSTSSRFVTASSATFLAICPSGSSRNLAADRCTARCIASKVSDSLRNDIFSSSHGDFWKKVPSLSQILLVARSGSQCHLPLNSSVRIVRQSTVSVSPFAPQKGDLSRSERRRLLIEQSECNFFSPAGCRLTLRLLLSLRFAHDRCFREHKHDDLFPRECADVVMQADGCRSRDLQDNRF